jgi:voltage-gated potassium channel Kch
MAKDEVKHEITDELKNTTYELFIAALSILSIFNLFFPFLTKDPNVDDVVLIMNGVLSLIFLCDFLFRLFTTSSKATYFFRQFGWADLLASLPFPQVKLLRLFRIFRAARLIRRYGTDHLVREFLGNRGGSALLTLLFFMIVVVEFGAVAILVVEQRSPDANIKNASDAVWYLYVTITTVGYGDRYPVTNAGRLIGVLVMTMGVGLFGTLTGFLANFFLTPKQDGEASKAEASQ